MQLQALLLATGAALAVAAPNRLNKRECHGSGETWGGDKFRALQIVQEYCDGQINGPFTTSGQYINKCVNLSSEKKIDFFLRWDGPFPEGSPPIALDKDRCTSRFQDEINGCEHGGRRSWEAGDNTPAMTFSADPNAGQCA